MFFFNVLTCHHKSVTLLNQNIGNYTVCKTNRFFYFTLCTKSVHCILQTEDERDDDITGEMVVCSLLGGDLGSSNNPAGATLGAVGILEIPKT